MVGVDWAAQMAYNMERAMVHGDRRAAEMEEVAKTLADLGLPSAMAEATVGWQRRLAAADVPPPADPRQVGAATVADSLLSEIRKK